MERLLQDQRRALEADDETLPQNQQGLVTELEAAVRLQGVATQLMSTRGTGELLEQILDAATAILRADFASIQMFYPERGPHGELRLLGHRGFSEEAAKRWEWVCPTTQTSCGEALRTRRRVVAPDIRHCDFIAGSDDLQAYLNAGIKAVQTTPLVSGSGALVGMVSTHWREPREPAASELRSLDILARMAADLIERSRAEEALAKNHQHLASIYDTVRDVIFHLAVEPEGQFRFLSVNEAFSRVTGLSREMVVGRTVNQVIPEPSLSVVLSKYRQAIEEKTNVNWEETSEYPSGRLTGEVNVVPVFDDVGTCTHLVGSVHDITERKKAEQRFHSLLEAAPDAMVVVDREGKIFLTNMQTERLFGYKCDELCGKSVEILIPERFRANHSTQRRHFFQKPKVREIGAGLELYGLHKDGREFPVEISLSPLETEKGMLVTSAIRDVTERKRTEAALRESEQRLVLAQNAAQLGVWDRDLSTNVITIRGMYAQIYGLSPDRATVTREEWLSLIHPADRERVDALTQEARQRTHTFDAEFRVIWPNGSTHWVHAKGTVLTDDFGQPSRTTGVVWDVTEVKRSQEEASLRQKLESLGTLASGIAHDFNNLLGAVLAQAELAEADLREGSSPEGELKTIRDIAMRGSEIVRELMIYAGRESRGVELVDVSEVIEQILELLKVSVSKHVALTTDLSQNLPGVRATAAQISQLVMNLATNASEALGNRDGVVRITTRCVIVGHGSETEGSAEGEYVQLEVSDTGCGILPEMHTRIFDPFFSTKSGGRGLGLAVVHGIVKELGGAINLVSEPGHGTTFKIMLPCVESQPSAIRGPISDIGLPAQESRAAVVLVVEDEGPLRRPVSKMLRKHGFSVIEVGDGSAALDAIRAQNNTIDVLLLDITLPGASAWEVLQEARRQRPEMKVIITSAYPEEMAGALLQCRMEHFIRKPYSVYDLVRVIDSTRS